MPGGMLRGLSSLIPTLQVDSVDAREASKPPPPWQQWLGQFTERLKYKVGRLGDRWVGQ